MCIFCILKSDQYCTSVSSHLPGIHPLHRITARPAQMYIYDVPSDDDAKEIIFGFVSGGYSMLVRTRTMGGPH